ncbi:MAG: hypothetical protein B0W54_00285 [Cellvibrio sp. 79]|nr:MAG: hypothetical protein B0W54_00285 [Cellvibrio sp. 79]
MRRFGAILISGSLTVFAALFKIAPLKNKSVPVPLKIAFIWGEKIYSLSDNPPGNLFLHLIAI